MKKMQRKCNPSLTKHQTPVYLTIDPSIYKYITGRAATVNQEIKETMKLVRIDGTDFYIEGAQYPKRSPCTDEALWSANQAKVLFVEFLKLSPYLLFAGKEKVIHSYTKIAMKAAKPFLLKRIYLTPVARELQDMVYSFLSGINISHQVAMDFAEIFSFMIDIDTAYRYPFQDIAGETTKEKLLAHPIGEMKRLMKIFQARDEQEITFKFRMMQYILTVLLLIPKYRSLFKEIVRRCEFKNLQFTEGERYWVHMQPGYKYFGLTLKQRQKLLKKNYQQIPVFYSASSV